jgi:hypothetical protein
MAAKDTIGAKRKAFRKLLSRKRLTVMPQGFSPLYAMLAQQASAACSQLSSICALYALARPQSAPQNTSMRTRSSAIAVRIAMAAIFGFMSLFHGPIMASANADPAAMHHVAQNHAHAAHHHAHQHQPSSPAAPDAMPACYGIGCFIVLNPLVAAAPEATLQPIAILSPQAARVLVPIDRDPLLPPPRIQV